MGHTFSKGCFRCHDSAHVDKDGNAIANSCSTCHEIIGQSTGNEKVSLTDFQEFIHPEDIEDLWSETSCTDCHNGGGAFLDW